MMRKYIHVLILGVAVLALAGCRGSSLPIETPLDTGPGQELLQQQNEERMAPTPDPQTADVTGSLTTSGLTAILPGEGGGAASAVPAQIPNERILVRLIDPEDDILHEVHPDIGGSFSLSYSGTVVDAKLQVSMTVAEDLDGDGAGMEPIIQNVPLKLAPGHTAKVDLSMELVSGDVSPGSVPPYEGDLAPQAGSVLLVNVSVQDASGLSENYYGVFFADERTVYDADGDNVLELGDDYAGEDSNLDGWLDPFEPDTEPGGVPFEPLFLEGTVHAVDVSDRVLQLGVVDGSTQEILVPPTVSIEVYSADPAGGFVGLQELGEWMVGRFVHIDALETPEGLRAEWIIVDETPPPVSFPPPPAS
jgi:hypothetical protein